MITTIGEYYKIQKESIDTRIHEIATDLAVFQLADVLNMKDEDLTDPLYPEDPDSPREYKPEYQPQYEELSGRIYEQICTLFLFDPMQEDGILRLENGTPADIADYFKQRKDHIHSGIMGFACDLGMYE